MTGHVCVFICISILQGRQNGHAEWVGDDGLRTHSGSGNDLPRNPLYTRATADLAVVSASPSMDEACKMPLRFLKAATEGESSGDESGILDEQCIDAGSLPAPLSCARAGVRVQPSPAAARSDEPDWCAVRVVARCEQGLLPVFTTAETGSRVFRH